MPYIKDAAGNIIYTGPETHTPTYPTTGSELRIGPTGQMQLPSGATQQSWYPTGSSVQSQADYTVGGDYNWKQLEEQAAEFKADLTYRYWYAKLQDAQFAREMADREYNTFLRESEITGYIGGSETLERQIAQWSRQQQQEELGLNYLQLLSQQTGPRNWLTYENTLRNAKNTNLPAYAQSMMQGRAMPRFQSTLGTTSGYNSYQDQTLAPGTDQYGNVIGGNGGNWQNWYGGSQQGAPMDYATAIQQARQGLARMDGRWTNATDAQIIQELTNNPTLFVNSPIRSSITQGPTAQIQQAGGAQAQASAYGAPQIQPSGQMAQPGVGPVRGTWYQNAENAAAGQNGTTPAGTAKTPANDWGAWLQQQGQTAGWLTGNTGLAQPQGAPQAPAIGSSSSGAKASELPQLNALRARPQWFNNLTPAEREMLAGQIEGQGGSWNDWQDLMQRSWAQGTARGQAQYGF